MAAYRRVDDLSHLRADCLYTGISSWPIARELVWEAFYIFFTFTGVVSFLLHFFSLLSHFLALLFICQLTKTLEVSVAMLR